jgi:hypothetical protein
LSLPITLFDDAATIIDTIMILFSHYK